MKKHPLNQSGNGKGSANRTGDIRRFQSEFDRIFGKRPSNKDKKAISDGSA